MMISMRTMTMGMRTKYQLLSEIFFLNISFFIFNVLGISI